MKTKQPLRLDPVCVLTWAGIAGIVAFEIYLLIRAIP